jgi:aspartate racemase
MTRRTIGILGGMGPLATVDLYRKIVESTPARIDQDHIPVLIDADPRVPDRTTALLGNGEDPLPWLIRGTQRLQTGGVDFVVMPCNTAHAYLDQIREACPVPFIDMIDEAARTAASIVPPGSPVGILATTGTIRAALYQSALERHDLHWLVPDQAGQEQVMQTIYQVKAGSITSETVKPVLASAEQLIADGATALLAACTELPVVLTADDLRVPLIDPTDVLARAAVLAATDDQAFVQLQRRSEKVRSNVD